MFHPRLVVPPAGIGNQPQWNICDCYSYSCKSSHKDCVQHLHTFFYLLLSTTLSRSTLPPFPGELGNRLGKFERIIAREGALYGRAEFESRPRSSALDHSALSSRATRLKLSYITHKRPASPGAMTSSTLVKSFSFLFPDPRVLSTMGIVC